MSKILLITFFLKNNLLKKKLLVFSLSVLLLFNFSYAQQISSKVPGTFRSFQKKQKETFGDVPNTVARLQPFQSLTGKYTLSADGIGSTGSSMNIRVNKPNALSTVQRAILISTVTGGTIGNGCVTLRGVPVNFTNTASASSSFFNNYWTDVTSIVATQINSFPAGISTLPITECSSGIIDGEALLVIFDDPAATEKTIVILIGAQDPTGDNFPVTLAQPINPTQSGALLDMGLGIGYSYQTGGSQQYSQVSVNGQRLSTSAGGEDDGTPSNGALITVGGIGDVNTNPANPLATPTIPRSDDELYNILPFINSTTTSLIINSINPSNDDNIFLAYFVISGAAIIGEGILLSQTETSGIVGTSHTVKASVLNTNGQPVANRLVTFTITSGPNAGLTFSTNTNASGEAFYNYIGNGGPGTDNIQACFTNSQNVASCSNMLSFLWVMPTDPSVYYSKSSGDLHNVLTWGRNMDGSGANPPDFTAGKTFILANRPGIYTLTSDWTVGGRLNIPAASQLQISNFTLSIADILGTGSFNGTTASNLVVTTPSSGGTSLNFMPSANDLNSLNIVSTATTTLTAALDVFGVLILTNGTLNTGNALTLKSSAANTARVAPITGAVSGTVTVERYIPARRAWRILAAPIGGTQSINAAWQEGATTASATPDPNPGFGTHITEGSPANGFDQNPFVAMVSAKRYVSATNSWVNLANTNATSINADAYMLFVRGNRGTPLGYNSVPATITTLRCTGPLKVGDQLFPVSGTGFTAIPNPFASPINFATLTKTGVQDNFYVWDPKVGGTNGVGAYVTVSFNGTSYDISSNAISPESQYIQSGQGFLVSATTAGVAGSLTIKESDKSNTAAADVFRTVGGGRNPVVSNAPIFADPTQGNGLRLQLQTVNADNTTAALDEVFASYKPDYSNKVDKWDAAKATNMAENLGMVRDDKTLAIERKLLPVDGELINLKLWNVEPKNYILKVNPVNLSSMALFAYLEDKYLKTFTSISLDKTSSVNFSINNNPASARADRFNIVFSKNGKLATDLITNTNITAYPNPVTDRNLNLQFTDQPSGTYLVTIVNGAGNVIFEKSVQHIGGSVVKTITLDKKLLPGVYQLQVLGNHTKATSKILSR